MLQKEEIKNLLETAFSGVTLNGGISLEQTKSIDNYGRDMSVEKFIALPNKEIINDWKEIPKSVLDEADCLAHLDQKGIKYYISTLMLGFWKTTTPRQ